MASQHFLLTNMARQLRLCKRRIADALNDLLRRRSKRGQRAILLTMGIVLAAACTCQVVYSIRDRAKLRIARIVVPVDILGDTTECHHSPHIIGVLIPRNPAVADSLWIAGSIHRRYFIGNRIRWLEIQLDSLKAFQQTHYYKPIR